MAVVQFKQMHTASELLQHKQVADPQLTHAELSGRISEFSAHGPSTLLTMGVGLVLDAQYEGEPAAWVMLGEDTFFPPDLFSAGVDLEALAVVRAPNSVDCFKAATRLAHSGAFGLIVIDLSQDAQSFVHRALTALLSRLVGLSQTHDLAVVILTTKSPEEASLDSLISLRGEARRGESLGGGRFSGQLEITKDKRRGPYWKHRNQFVGPPGIW